MEMFVKVVERGSFTATAELCQVSPTMVAKHIHHIEKRLGARLLHRTTRRQHLTEVGQLYYERCKHALAEVEHAEASASELQANPRGLIRLAAPASFGNYNLVPVLTDYLLRYPDVNVELTLGNRVPELIYDGYDLGIQTGEIDSPDLVARPLRPYRRILAAAPNYIARYGEPDHPEQLSKHSCLGITYWRRHDKWQLIGPNAVMYEVAVKGRFSANQGSTLRTAALLGAGIVLQPEMSLTDDIKEGRLLHILPEWSFKTTPMYLIYPQDARPTAKLRSIIDFLVQRFGLATNEDAC